MGHSDDLGAARLDVSEVGDTLTVRWRSQSMNAIDWLYVSAACFIAVPGNVAATATGVVLAFVVLSRATSETTVRATPDGLHISHGPLPLRRACHVTRRELEQLSVEPVGGRKLPRAYSLCAVDRRGRRRTLLAGLPARDQASSLEIQLERRLGIRLRPLERAEDR
jgi:hypothetical protein